MYKPIEALIDYLNELSDHVLNSSITFRDLVVQIETLSEEELKKRILIIKEYELKGDQVERTMIEELVRCFITPLDREDLHTLAVDLDKPLDLLKDLTRKIEVYQIRKMPINVCKFADIIVEIATIQKDIVRDLSTKQKVRYKVEQMHKLENQADELFDVSMAELFHGKDRESVLTIGMVKLKEVYEGLEETVDRLDDVGKLVRGIKIKHG